MTARVQTRGLDVAYASTPSAVVDAMLELGGVIRDDVVYDLGSGDGRIVVAAAKGPGARGVGIDLDPERIAEATALARREGVTDRVTFILGDLFQADIHDATVVMLYLQPEAQPALALAAADRTPAGHTRRVALLRYGRLDTG